MDLLFDPTRRQSRDSLHPGSPWTNLPPIVIMEVNLLKKVEIEISVNEDLVEPTIAAIIEGARTGEIGDGKIFVLDLQDCIRIRTGERGSEAIG